jgi:hypothetical protein
MDVSMIGILQGHVKIYFYWPLTMHIGGNPIQSISPQSNPIQMTWRGGAPGATGAAKIGVKRRDGRRRYGDKRPQQIDVAGANTA